MLRLLQLQAGAGKLRSIGQIQPVTCTGKENFIGIWPHWVRILSTVAFNIQQNWIVARKTIWSIKAENTYLAIYQKSANPWAKTWSIFTGVQYVLGGKKKSMFSNCWVQGSTYILQIKSANNVPSSITYFCLLNLGITKRWVWNFPAMIMYLSSFFVVHSIFFLYSFKLGY